MDEDELMQFLTKIKEECTKHTNCEECPMYAGQSQITLCIMDAQADVFATPEEWDIDLLMNLKDE